MILNEIIMSAGMGILGSITKEILVDNKIVLPRKVNGELCLGFLGGITVGAIAGYLVDGNPITAFLGGYAGKSIIETLVAQNGIAKINKPETILKEIKTEKEEMKDIIRRIAKEEGIDEELALRVATCESGLNPKAIGKNTNGSRDRGLYQINDKWHDYITDEQAFDPEFSIKFFCDAVKNNNLSWWNASKKCWGPED